MGELHELKIILREESSPFFTDEELEYYLTENDNDLNKTAYHCLILKSEDDSISLPGGLSIPNNKSYWLKLASKYRANKSRCL